MNFLQPADERCPFVTKEAEGLKSVPYLCRDKSTMKKIIFSLTLLFAVVFASCQQPALKTEAKNETVATDQFEKLLAEKSNAQILDVRTPQEFASGHIKGAFNLDIYDAAFKEALGKLDKSRPVLVYCKSGGRSGQAAGMMKEMGFNEVYNLQGGMLAWTNAGKAVDNAGAVPKTAGLSEAAYLELVASKSLVLVDFNATWCAPCKKLAPILDEIVKKEDGRLTLIKIDADENPELMRAKQIEGIPYLELYKEGKLVWKNMGLTDASVISAQLK